MEDKYVGRKVDMHLDCSKGDDGWWTVVVTVTQSRSTDMINWEEAEAGVKSLDKDIDKAIQQAYISLYYYGDLFDEQDKSRLN